jgi:uncharacterized protein (TIGR03086 family)
MSGPDPGVVDRFLRAVARFDAVLAEVAPQHWDRPTPCADWNVRDLAAHLVDEQRWIAPLLAGGSLEEVGASLEDDVLGDDPHATWDRHRREAEAAVVALDDLETPVSVSFGQTPARHYLGQLAADHLVHSWDLARAVGGDEHLPAELVAEVTAWFVDDEDLWRGAGVIAERVSVPDDASARTRMLAAFGRDDGPTAAAVTRFDEAFGRRDVPAIMAAMTGDCVFEATTPPDGIRHVGPDAVRAAWEQIFDGSPAAWFETESLWIHGDRAVARWRYTWDESVEGHVRGVDLFAVRDGLVAEKLSYVKG